jgi:hypothetical protein
LTIGILDPADGLVKSERLWQYIEKSNASPKLVVELPSECEIEIINGKRARICF